MSEREITFECPACGASLSVLESLAGVHGPCPHCQTDITAPGRPDAPAPKSASAATPEPAPVFSKSPEPAAAAEAEPSKGKGALAAIVIAALAIAAGVAAYKYAAGGDDDPEPGDVAQAPPPSPAAENPSSSDDAAGDRSVSTTDAGAPALEENPGEPNPTPVTARTSLNQQDQPDSASRPEKSAPNRQASADGAGRTEEEPPSEPLTLEERYGFDEEAGILAPPRKALLSFLGSATWKERAKFVLNPDRTVPQMKDYHEEQGFDDGSIEATSVTFQNMERTPDLEHSFYLFHVTTDSVPEGFPVVVEETDNGLKVDWQSFVEFNDLHLDRYFSQFQNTPAQFHVILRRAHFFGSGVPDIDDKYVFRIEPPIPGHEEYAFVEKDAPLVTSKLEPYLHWSAISYPIVQIEWVRASGGEEYVVLRDIVQHNWRNDLEDGAENDAEAAAD